MTTPLLRTKLYIPPVRPELVSRPRLIERLNAGTTRKLQTSILDRMVAPLCNVVASRKDSQATLEQLEAANLFLIPLDDERRWYRYHPSIKRRLP